MYQYEHYCKQFFLDNIWHTIPLKLASDYTPTDLKHSYLFKQGTEPTEVSSRFSKLDTPTNGNALVNGSSITITWDPIFSLIVRLYSVVSLLNVGESVPWLGTKFFNEVVSVEDELELFNFA